MIIGFLAAFGTLFSWSFGTLAFLDASRRIDPGLLNKTRLLLAVGATAVLACATAGLWPWEVVLGPSAYQWFWLGLSGIVGLSVGDLFGFTSLRILGARRQSVVSTTAPVASGAVGFILLNETLSASYIVGMLLCLAGVMYAMSSNTERSDVHREGYGSYATGILLAIGGAFCQGSGLVLAKVGMISGEGISPFHATFMRMSVGFGATYVIDFIRRAPHRPLKEAFADKQGATSMYKGTVLGPILGVTLSLVAAERLNVAIAQTIFSLIPFVVMGIATLVHKEHLPWRSVLGAVIATIGIMIIVST